jgi:pimeloyl-ACP methyl ester carboxylesterase
MAEQVTIAGVSIELLRTGQGRPLVFLHPGDGIADTAAIIPVLAEHFDVIAPSLPGFGASELPQGFSTVDDLAYFCLDLLDALDLQDVILFGASFGAWVAMEVAVKSTARLAGLVLADALGVKFGAHDSRDIADLFSCTPGELPALLYHDSPKFTPDYANASAPELERMARNREAFALYGWSPTLYDPKLRQRLHRIKLPTLLLWGADDRVVSTEYGRALAGMLASARLAIIRDCGHYPHIEQPEAVGGQIRQFVATSADPARSRVGVRA